MWLYDLGVLLNFIDWRWFSNGSYGWLLFWIVDCIFFGGMFIGINYDGVKFGWGGGYLLRLRVCCGFIRFIFIGILRYWYFN